MKFDRKSHEGYLIEELVGKNLSKFWGLKESLNDFRNLIKKRLGRFLAADKKVNWKKVNFFSKEISIYIKGYVESTKKKPIEIKHEGISKKGKDKSDLKILFEGGSFKNFSLKTYENLKSINMGDRGLFTVSKKLTGKKIVLDKVSEKKRLDFQSEYGATKGNKEEKKIARNALKSKYQVYQNNAKALADFFEDFLKTSKGQKIFKKNIIKDMGFEDKDTVDILVINENPARILLEEPESVLKLRNPSSKLTVKALGVSTVIYLDNKEIIKISFRDRGSQCTYWVDFSQKSNTQKTL